MKRFVYITPGLFLALLVGCSQAKPALATPPAAQAKLVRTISQETPQTIEMTGTLRAKQTAIISAQMPGHIRQVWVEAGAHVRAGQLLVTLDDAAMQSALNQASAAQTAVERQQAAARSNAQLAAGTLARYQILKDEKSVSPQEFDEVEKRSQAAALELQALQAQSEGAKAAVTGARTQLGYTALHAPFSGVISARLADPGTLAAPGGPLLQLDSDGPLQVYTTVDELLIGSTRLGMQVPVSIEGTGQTGLVGTVAEIVPVADPASHTFLVKLNLPALKNGRSGMYVRVGFPGAKKVAVLAPQSAVVMRGSLACVYALDAEGIARLQVVTLGNRHGDQVEVLSGVGPGERLVDNPGDRDLAGRRIDSVRKAQP